MAVDLTNCPPIANRVQQSAGPVGLGDISMTGQFSCSQSFASEFVAGDQVMYTITDCLDCDASAVSTSGGNWEVGCAEWDGTKLLRSSGSVESSSNAGALVNFTAEKLAVFHSVNASWYSSICTNLSQELDCRVPIGSSMPWEFNAPPSGWLVKDGSYYNVDDFPELGALYGGVSGGTFSVTDWGETPAPWVQYAGCDNTGNSVGSVPYVTDLMLVTTTSGQWSTGDQLCVDVVYDQPVSVSGTPSINADLFAPSYIQSNAVDGVYFNIQNLYDNDPTTWAYNFDQIGSQAYFQVTMDFGANVARSGAFVDLPSFAQSVTKGYFFPKSFELYVSSDGISFTQLANELEFDGGGLPVMGNYQDGTSDYTFVRYSTSYSTPFRYLRLSINGNHYATPGAVYSDGTPFSGGVDQDDAAMVSGLGAIETGSPSLVVLDYVSGSGSGRLTFCWTIQAGDVADQLNINGRTVNGGPVTGLVGGLAANTALPTLTETVDVN